MKAAAAQQPGWTGLTGNLDDVAKVICSRSAGTLDRQIFSYFRSVPLQLIQVRVGVGTASAASEACPLDNRP